MEHLDASRVQLTPPDEPRMADDLPEAFFQGFPLGDFLIGTPFGDREPARLPVAPIGRFSTTGWASILSSEATAASRSSTTW